jgi:hypothetical protein
MAKPMYPLMTTTTYNLSAVLIETVYIGFSAASSNFGGTQHYVLGRSFRMGGPAPAIDIATLPQLPQIVAKSHSISMQTVSLIAVVITIILLTVGTIVYLVRRRFVNADLLKDWEIEFGPHRFVFKDLFQATEGFKDKHLIGRGGFG